MKRLILKLSLFFLLLLIIKAPVFYFYEDEFEHRRNAFAAQNFDTVFVGSSRTYLGIIPAYFDDLTHGRSKTYNLGVHAAVPPQTFDWCEEIIENKTSLKNIFVELSGGIDQVPFYEDPLKRFSLAEYGRIWHLLDLAKLSDYHDHRALGLFKPQFSSGHFDYNLPYAADFSGRELSAKKVSNPKVLEFTRRLNWQIENENFSDFPVNEYYWKRVCRLIKLAEAKQIRIQFFVPPRLFTESELAMIAPIYQKLNEKYKFRASHHDESLYRDDTSSDDFHLNYNGAKRFTEILAEEFNKRNF
jgi:hypothetical protein